jgi:hypothetical protein
MTRWSFPIGGQIAVGCLAFDEPSNSLWFGTDTGEIWTFRLPARARSGRVTVDQPLAPQGHVCGAIAIPLSQPCSAQWPMWGKGRRKARSPALHQIADIGASRLSGISPELMRSMT